MLGIGVDTQPSRGPIGSHTGVVTAEGTPSFFCLVYANFRLMPQFTARLGTRCGAPLRSGGLDFAGVKWSDEGPSV